MKVICFDFDDVIVKTNTVRRLIKLFGHGLKVFKVEAEFLRDNMEPDKFFNVIKKLVYMGKGLEFERVKRYMIRFGLSKGVVQTFKELKRLGYKIIIASTNDERIIKEFLKKHDLDKYIDHIYASRIGVKNGLITGKIYGDVVRTEKTGVVDKIKKKYGVSNSNIIYVGDGLTDLPVIKLVGCGILFCPNKITTLEVFNNTCLYNKKKEGGLIIIKKRDLREVLRFVD